jgi:hypothetical protein
VDHTHLTTTVQRVRQPVGLSSREATRAQPAAPLESGEGEWGASGARVHVPGSFGRPAMHIMCTGQAGKAGRASLQRQRARPDGRPPPAGIGDMVRVLLQMRARVPSATSTQHQQRHCYASSSLVPRSRSSTGTVFNSALTCTAPKALARSGLHPVASLGVAVCVCVGVFGGGWGRRMRWQRARQHG